MASTYTPIATTTLGSAVATYTFNSIPSTFTDLLLVANTNQTSTSSGLSLQFNGDTGANYSFTYMQGNASAASSNRASNVYSIDHNYQNAGTWGQTYININNYSNTTTYKTTLSRASQANTLVMSHTGLWRSTAAINSIKILVSAGNYDVNSTFTLYGIKAA